MNTYAITSHPVRRPWRAAAAATGLAVALAACSQSNTSQGAKVAGAAPAPIAAPAGRYAVDPYHATLEFRVSHLGLANYVARFTRFEAAVQLDPANLPASSVEVTIDPVSVRTDFAGDYTATHAGSPYRSFDEALAQSPKFFNAGQYPRIAFKSTKVEEAAPGRLRVTGDLTLLGKTLPVALDAVVVGSAAAHPFHKRGAIGFSATGTFNRSAFGMTDMLQPPLIGDAVTIQFDGEFHQAGAAGA